MAASKAKDVRTVPLATLRLDGGTQARAGLDEATVEEYAAVAEAASFDGWPDWPPLEAVEDEDGTLWLWDGFHRAAGCHEAGMAEARVNVRPGALDDARWLACSANTAHGLRRDNAAKRRAVEMALGNPKSAGLSSRAVALHCGVSHTFVDQIRSQSDQVATVATSRREGQDGKSYPASGKRAAAADDAPPAPSQEESEAVLAANAEAEPREPLAGTAEGERLQAAARAAGACDADGTPIPEKALPAFALADEMARACRLLDQAAAEIERLGRSEAAAGAVLWTAAQSQVKAARAALWKGRPYRVCPYCRGRKDRCEGCKGRGWVGAVAYNGHPDIARARRERAEADAGTEDAAAAPASEGGADAQEDAA